MLDRGGVVTGSVFDLVILFGLRNTSLASCSIVVVKKILQRRTRCCHLVPRYVEEKFGKDEK